MISPSISEEDLVDKVMFKDILLIHFDQKTLKTYNTTVI